MRGRSILKSFPNFWDIYSTRNNHITLHEVWYKATRINHLQQNNIDKQRTNPYSKYADGWENIDILPIVVIHFNVKAGHFKNLDFFQKYMKYRATAKPGCIRFRNSLYTTVGWQYSKLFVINFWFLFKSTYTVLFRIKFSIEWYINWLPNHVHTLWKMNNSFTLKNTKKAYLAEYYSETKI